ncbi:MAG: response regulator [Acidobacteria bacterium]|nr:response regulator [Acidobacteriota bacterium]
MVIKPLHVLIVDDSQADALLLVYELKRSDYEVTYERVETPEAMRAALDQREWDIVISDYHMPQFTGIASLALLKQEGLDLPFIIVSGTIGEELAVEVMKSGANDYIMKDNLRRLVPAVERELREAAGRRARKQAEEALRRTEEQLRQSQKLEAIGRLAGGIAHDFNNHLGIIIGFGELLVDALGSDDPLRKKAEMIREAGLRAASLTRQLLAFSRKQVMEPRVLDLNAVVTELNYMLRPLIGEDIELVELLSPKLGKVRVDPSQIDEIIMNLAVNARDAMPKGGKLTIETANVELDETYLDRHVTIQPGPYVMLAVTDTGIGMDKEIQAHIFEPFFTTKEKDKGTGLGLAMVYGIVKQSGGYIWVYSEVGQGTTFKIYLPRLDVAVPATKVDKVMPSDLTGSETILIAEDEAMLRELACEFLASAGYTILQAGSGEQALKISECHQGPIHLLMTDAVMPRMGGSELAQRLQSQRPDIKVLFVSGYTDDAVFRNGLVTPGTAFLQKPFTRETLLFKLREVLQGERNR